VTKKVCFYSSLIPVLLVLVVTSAELSAYQPRVDSVDVIARDAVQISRVEIVSASAVLETYASKEIKCGVDYTVKVIENLKGEVKFQKFRSFSNLTIGTEYLVFLSSDFLEARALFLSMGRNDPEAFESCKKGIDYFASESHGQILQFDWVWNQVTDELALKIPAKLAVLLGIREKIAIQLKSPDAVPEYYLEYGEYALVPWADILDVLIRDNK